MSNFDNAHFTHDVYIILFNKYFWEKTLNMYQKYKYF